MVQKNKNRSLVRGLFLILSIGAFCVAVWFWSRHFGFEFSVFFALFHLTWLSWLVVAHHRRFKSNGREKNYVSRYPAEKSWWFKSAVLVMAGPMALLASIVISLGLARLLIEDSTNQWVVMFMLVPFVWGLWSFWLAADNRLLRPASVMLIMSLAAWWVVA